MNKGIFRRVQCLAFCAWMLVGSVSAALGEETPAQPPEPASVAAHHEEREERHHALPAGQEREAPGRGLEKEPAKPAAQERPGQMMSLKERISRVAMGLWDAKPDVRPGEPGATDDGRRFEAPRIAQRETHHDEPHSAPREKRPVKPDAVQEENEKPGQAGRDALPREPDAAHQDAGSGKPDAPRKKQGPALSPKEKVVAAFAGPEEEPGEPVERPELDPAGVREENRRAEPAALAEEGR